jgi:hypothetical protein
LDGNFLNLFPGGDMRKLVLILIAFIAVATFIRAFDNGSAAVAASALSTQAPVISGERAE